jgi:hypothetical protein
MFFFLIDLTTHLNIKLLKANLYFILNKAINNFTKNTITLIKCDFMKC